MFTPSRHGQKHCEACGTNDNIKRDFQRSLRNRERVLRVLRAKTSRGIPKVGQLRLPDLPEDWRTSEEKFDGIPLKDLAEDFYISRNPEAGREERIRRFKQFEPKKPEYAVVPWPKHPFEKEARAWTSPKPGRKGKGRDEIIATHVHNALSHPHGWCDICRRYIPADFPISREDSPDGGVEMRANPDKDKLDQQREENERHNEGLQDGDYIYDEN
jgi:hypothetical protein